MAVNINKFRIAGTITADLAITTTPSGNKVVNFTLAINEGKDSQGNEITRFIPCEAWNSSAENLAKYMGKGSQLQVEGRIVTRQNSQKHTTLCLIGTKFDYIQTKEQRRLLKLGAEMTTPSPIQHQDEDIHDTVAKALATQQGMFTNLNDIQIVSSEDASIPF